jgi:hypothetical protein
MTISSVKTGAIGDSLLAGNTAYVPPSFDSIATLSGNGLSSVTFSSIPGTYASLQIRMMTKPDANLGGTNIRFNGDSSTIYSGHYFGGSGSTTFAGNLGSGLANVNVANLWETPSATYMTTTIIDINDYASTSRNKTFRSFFGQDVNAAGGEVTFISGLYRSTSAITSITLLNNAGSYSTGTVFSLYGIRG